MIQDYKVFMNITKESVFCLKENNKLIELQFNVASSECDSGLYAYRFFLKSDGLKFLAQNHAMHRIKGYEIKI